MFFRFLAVLWVVSFRSNSPIIGVDAFLPTYQTRNVGWIAARQSVAWTNHVSLDDNHVDAPTTHDDDEELLKEVKKSQLVELCIQYNLSTSGTKEALLERLRDYANNQAELERKRRQDRIARVEETDNHGKERHEIVNDYPEDDDDDDEAYFYFEIKNTTAKTEETPPKTKPPYVTNNVITAPPAPPQENENGERVVTVYSTKDHNDLTGVAAAQPNANESPMMAGSSSASAAPWDAQQSHYKAEASSKELEQAKETVAELVHSLLLSTGAPAFQEEFSEGLTPVNGRKQHETASSPADGFVGFDPSKVATDVLVASSQALRADRGRVLQDVLRDYELRAVGHDGMAGDDVEKGGGHYREVSKVRAFLEGYRRAEVRRVARETTTVLLDKLVMEGIEGLDTLLATMTKTGDDTGEGGELNDALLDYLNDAIRQQQKKVEQLVGTEKNELPSADAIVDNNDAASDLDKLWNVTSEDGERVETLDPNDPLVKKLLTEEYTKSETNGEMVGMAKPTPTTAPEQLLLLLNLLRERIKAEAAFSSDEKGRNLRILAYCLQSGRDNERRQIISREVGTSVDRIDSFMELVASSIEYVESTSHQLQPSRSSRPLNIRSLKSILKLAKDMREKQAGDASKGPYNL